MEGICNIVQKGMSPIRTTILAAGAILSLSLLMGCNNQEASGTGTPTNEARSTAVPTASNAPTASAEVPSDSEGLTSQFPLEGVANLVRIDSVNDAGMIRARSAAGQGELLMIASGPEERGHLNVSTNNGLEGEQTYQADYSIVYRSGKQDQVLLKLPAFLFVRPSDQVLEFDTVRFKDAEVYLLAPQYKSGHGLVAYAFAVDKISGEVFPLSFKQGGIVHDTLVYSEIQPAPANQNEQLVVHSPEGAGTDPELKPRVYDLDLEKRQFIAR